jgi:hypothetical protein
MQLQETGDDPRGFERSLPFKFRSFMVELGAAVTPGGNGIVIYRGFKAIATLSRADAEALSEADQMAIRKAFNTWGADSGNVSWATPQK